MSARSAARQLNIAHPLVKTPYVDEATLRLDLVSADRQVALIDGPCGTGKTTTVEWYADQSGQPAPVVMMPPTIRGADALRHIGRRVCGHEMTDGPVAMQEEVIEALTDSGGLLIVDEVQNLGAQGIAMLRYLHDRTRRHGRHAFSLVLVGYGVGKVIAKRPELASRVLSSLYFAPLRGGQLTDYLHQRDPRLAASVPAALVKLNSTYAGGLLRRWEHVLRAVDALHLEQVGPDQVPDILHLIGGQQ